MHEHLDLVYIQSNLFQVMKEANTWRRSWQIRIRFMMKSRVDQIQGMLVVIQSRIFCLPVSYQKT
jgi:hypothetical protein